MESADLNYVLYTAVGPERLGGFIAYTFELLSDLRLYFGLEVFAFRQSL